MIWRGELAKVCGSSASRWHDGDIALSNRALEGADMWIDPVLRAKLFLSGELVDALHAANINVDMDLKTCRVVEAATGLRSQEVIP
ncbi:MAG: hypothetical protein AAFP79_10995 [Pseudomonadota bacterium]